MISIHILPDEVLLAIFDFCDDGNHRSKKGIDTWWRTLVHVCRRWRTVVFGSPLRLNLRLKCVPRTPANNTLDVWPSLPLVISNLRYTTSENAQNYFRMRQSATKQSTFVDNIVGILEHSNRVCQILLFSLPRLPSEIFLAAMQAPFPELTEMWFSSVYNTAVVPNSFLGGSTPLLRKFFMRRISFPGLPKLLLSATHLDYLNLEEIPHSGYFSPEALLTALSVCTNLRHLTLRFQSPRSCPDHARQRLLPQRRSVLPVITDFSFNGASEYLDDLVVGIDTPGLKYLFITFFNDIEFDTPQLAQFISRIPTSKLLKSIRVSGGGSYHRLELPGRVFQELESHLLVRVDIRCRGLDWAVSHLEQLCASFLPFLPKFEVLLIELSEPDQVDNIENTQWLELLRPCAAVKDFGLLSRAARFIVPALQELAGDRITEVLPALQRIILEPADLEPGPVQEGIWQLVAARQLTGHPIAISSWRRD